MAKIVVNRTHLNCFDGPPHRRIEAGATCADVLGDRVALVEPEVTHTIGLVAPQREPMTPLLAALVTEAKMLAVNLGEHS